MTELLAAGHSGTMYAAATMDEPALESAARKTFAAGATSASARPSFEAAYAEHFDFLWRLLGRLGTPRANLDDAVQEVFLVVHRRLGEFQGRSSLRTWLAGIAVRVASDQRRLLRRKGAHEALEETIEDCSPGPEEGAEQAEAFRLVQSLVGALDEEKRQVFVLAELEEMTAPEISDVLGVKLNTVYSRLRAGRAEFEKALERQARRNR